MSPKLPAAGGESHEPDSFLFNRKIPLLNKNRSAEDRTAAVGNYVAEAPRRRRRIPRAGFFLV